MVKKWIVSFGGIGLLPVIPGTYASFVAAVIFYLALNALGEKTVLVMFFASLLVGIVGVCLASWAEGFFRVSDPRRFVLDEVMGQWLTLIFLPLAASDKNTLSYIIAGFFLFRAFDIAKPFPIRKMEQLSRGWGIMLDDAVAAVYANISLWILVFVVRGLHNLPT